MKIILGNLAAESENIIRFQKSNGYFGTSYEIHIVMKDKSKSGEVTSVVRFTTEQERDAAFEKLVEVWTENDDVVKI
jgi:hypothetical protein